MSNEDYQSTDIAPTYGPMFGLMGSAAMHAFAGKGAAPGAADGNAERDESAADAPPED
ncbi:hypothetical protein [Streptomyces subrutilus]|uniref:hypothetical protein n=1 Tax=Streptomyces subrutilus TaxID=36818 RepID=UPI002E0FD5D0|nr:hypothetical protein OG479_06625 [Streptomyces subrutilus]